MDGARRIDYYGYEGCVALQNELTRVVLGPHCGGRVLEYAWRGENALYLDPAQAGWVYTPGAPAVHISGGRCDIGPEHTVPRHPTLWLGPWEAEVTGPWSARMTSADDPATGSRLVRDFVLDRATSRLTFTQTIVNISRQTTHWCHWSRTFALHGGIGVVPLTSSTPTRFPRSYVMYGPGAVIDFRPDDPAVLRRRAGDLDYLVIRGTPQRPKLGFDSYAGWLAYLLPGGLLFGKRFTADAGRVYNEVAALTSCIYYPAADFVELEPIGPRETLAPGESAAFTEEWSLHPFPFPDGAEEIDLAAVARAVSPPA